MLKSVQMLIKHVLKKLVSGKNMPVLETEVLFSKYNV